MRLFKRKRRELRDEPQVQRITRPVWPHLHPELTNKERQSAYAQELLREHRGW